MSKNILGRVAIALLLLFVANMAVAALIVLTLPNTVGATVSLPVAGVAKLANLNRWGLLVPISGLPLNGRMADASGWTLWLTTRDTSGQGVDPKNLEREAAKVQKDLYGWQWSVLSWMYAFLGSEPKNAVVLAVLYTLGWTCWREYRRRLRSYQSALGFWPKVALEEVFGTKEVGLLSLRKRAQQVEEYTNRALLARPAAGTAAPTQLHLRVVHNGAAAVSRFGVGAAADPLGMLDYFQMQSRRAVEAEEQQTADLEYFAQAIPPLGFIGTVLGIGEAMIATRKLTAGGGLSEVASALGVAFNTTFVALVLFLVVEYLATQVRGRRAQVVKESEEFLEHEVFHELRTSAPGTTVAPAPGARR